MYALTFSRKVIKDLLAYADGVNGWGSPKGRQFYGAILMPDSGYFTSKSSGNAPKIVCPYQVNDIIAIQEEWARSATSYVYKIQPDRGDPSNNLNNEVADLTGYNFRPASTMPIDAARLFGRITSIVSWPLTQDIAKEYLSYFPGTSDISSSGVGKVIDYYTNGSRLLSTIRKNRNREVLNKSGQPLVTSSNDLPLVDSLRYYYLNMPTQYSIVEYESNSTLLVQSNQVLPRYLSVLTENINCLGESSTSITSGGHENPTIDGHPVDVRTLTIGDWVWYNSESEPSEPWEKFAWMGDMWRGFSSMINAPGEDYYLPAGWVYAESSSSDTYGSDAMYSPLGTYEDSNGLHYIYRNLYAGPIYATYKTKIVDPIKKLYVWLISGYLCHKNGDIYRGDVIDFV